MKEKDEIEELFKSVKGKMDVFDPSTDHKLSFVDKLADQNKVKPLVIKKEPLFKQWYAIAASFVLFASLAMSFYIVSNNGQSNLANISPEMENTQDFFTTAIESHLDEINKKAAPANKKLVEDTIKQLDKLETSYMELQIDLTKSGYDKRVISAMIKNFQKRVLLLENVLEKIDSINDLKSLNNENNVL